MAERIGYLGSASSDWWTSLGTQKYIGVQMEPDEYPTGVYFEYASTLGWYNGALSGDRIVVYLCDSNFNDKYELFGFYCDTSTGYNHTVNSATVDCPNLKGDYLYVRAVYPYNAGQDPDQIFLRGKITIHIYTKQNKYTVTIGSAAGGSIAVNKSSVTPGDTVTITPSPSTGYQYAGFSSSPAVTHISDKKFTMPSQNVTITPIFSKINYSITKTPNPQGGGTISVKKNGAEVSSANYGDTLTVEFTPASGYCFVNWGGNPLAEGSPTTFTMPASNLTIWANFALVGYAITALASPEGAGTITAPASATMGSVVQLSQSPASGYLFTGWSSEQVSIANNQFTMPAEAVTITANYQLGRSTGSLNKSAYTAGETAILTIVPKVNTFSHKYRLSFGPGMETDLISVPAGTTMVSIYIPLEWSKSMIETPKTGGVLMLQTYNGSTFVGEYEITGLSYAALNGTIPKLILTRAKESGAEKVDGKRAVYTITVPQGINSYRLMCRDKFSLNPSLSGFVMPDLKMDFPVIESEVVELEITYGQEIFTIMESVPAIVTIYKNVNSES